MSSPVTARSRIGVVIATRDRRGSLERCLRAIAAQRPTCGPIVVVDDGSADDTPALLTAWAGRERRALRNATSRGPAAARNRGWRALDTELVAFTDDDCVPDVGWLDRLAAALLAAPPEIAGVGGRVLALGGGVVSRYMTHHGILDPPASLEYLVTANCAYRRSCLEAVGGFDERVKTPGGEDPGLSKAVRDAGFDLARAPDAVVWHEYREGLLDFARTFFRYGRDCRVVLDR